MPFVSKRQAAWMHAKHPKMAKKWDKDTDWENLPESVADGKARKAVEKHLKRMEKRSRE